MRKLVCLLLIFGFLLAPCLSVSLIDVKAVFNNSVHNVNTGIGYATIQEAVNANETSDGNTITVGAGTYFEHVIVNKTLNILSENNGATIIDGQHIGTVVTVEANNVKISGFTIQNSGNDSQNPPAPLDCGIKLSPSSILSQNAIIENNTLKNNGCGILVQHSSSNTIANNAFSNNIVVSSWSYIFNFTTDNFENVTEGSEEDIFVLASSENLLENDEGVVQIYNSTANTIVNCSNQIQLQSSYYNTIANSSGSIFSSSSNNNTITHCSGTISLSSSDKNTLSYCSHGIKLVTSNDNIISHNELSTGESIEVPDQSNYMALSSCERNTISNNILTNATIYLGLTLGTQMIMANENTITNNTLVGGGISIVGSNNSITQNKISGAAEAIHIRTYPVTNYPNTRSRNNSISKNNIAENDVGLLTDSLSSSNEITENLIENNTLGLSLGGTDNTLRRNQLSGNKWNMDVGSPGENHIGTTNTVNGDPVYCLTNSSNINISPPSYPKVGYIALTNCSNVNVQGLTLSGNIDGITLSNCSNCIIQQTTIKNNMIAIHFSSSDYITVANNTIMENCLGLDLQGDYNKIEDNIISNNTIRLIPYWYPENWPKSYYDPIREWLTQGLGMYSGGIFMFGAQECTLARNKITDNEFGVFMDGSSFNIFRNNKMADNFQNFGIDPSHLFPYEWALLTHFPNETSPYVMNDVDASNTINERPICWWINQRDKEVPENAGYVFLANCTDIIIRSLQLQNNVEGILLYGAKNTVISDNEITGCSYGIRVLPSDSATVEYELNDTLSYNNIAANGVGISILAGNSTISNNQINKNIIGIHTKGDFNRVVENNITNNVFPPKEQFILGYQPAFLATEVYYYASGSGITFEGSNNTACYNTIQNNDVGVSSGIVNRGGGNWIYQNNFISNTYQTNLYSINIWNAGYSLGGNYWSTYIGADVFSGPYQNQTGSDALGDTHMRVGEIVSAHGLTLDQTRALLEQYDAYPLVAPISVFDVGVWNETPYSFNIVSNSVITDFIFDPISTGPYISFTVTADAGTAGFCRVAIPKNLLWAYSNWTVKIGGRSANYTIIPDSDTTYLMLGYAQGLRTVQIIGTHAVEEYTPFPIASTIAIAIIASSGIIALAALILKTRRTHPRS